jgi:hypothetical protein
MRTESMVLNNEEKVVISREEFRVLISQVFGYGGKEKWGGELGVREEGPHSKTQ